MVPEQRQAGGSGPEMTAQVLHVSEQAAEGSGSRDDMTGPLDP